MVNDATDSAAAALATSTPDGLQQAGQAAIAAARTLIDQVKTSSQPPLEVLDAYDEAMATLGDTSDRMDLVAVTHPDEGMRTAADAAKQELAKVRTDISLDRGLYDVLSGLDVADADAPTRHYVSETLRDFRRAGVDRDDAV